MKNAREPWHRPCRSARASMSVRKKYWPEGCQCAHAQVLRSRWSSCSPRARQRDSSSPRTRESRNDTSAAGKPLKGLSASQIAFFEAGKDDFAEAEIVADGLGPRFNLDSCAGCHIQPAIGGTSPRSNPQVPLAKAFGALNNVPSFIKEDGPIREARYRYKPDGSRDGGVHALYVISGRVDGRGSDARDCTIKQEDFESEVAKNNVIFRIPTPTFGLGPGGADPRLRDRRQCPRRRRRQDRPRHLGRPHRLLPTGNPNRNGNDGTIARFGWKAQNKSLLLFAGEAYNVEMGITNELFQSERDETAACQYAPTPNDFTNTDAQTPLEALTGIEKFAVFMRFLAPPTPSLTTPGGSASLLRGRALFATTGCALCHTPPSRPASRRWPRSAARTCTSSPTSSCTTWDRASRTTSCRVSPRATSSGRRRCGVSASGSSSCTTVARATSPRRSWPTRARPPAVPGLRGQPRHRSLQGSRRDAEAGPPELPALALTFRGRPRTVGVVAP